MHSMLLYMHNISHRGGCAEAKTVVQRRVVYQFTGAFHRTVAIAYSALSNETNDAGAASASASRFW